jgi:hypothetical protein
MKAAHGFTWGALYCLVLAGCAAWSPAPQFSQPYFVVDTGEAKLLHSLAKKQEALIPKCAEHNSCDHVYFTRALLGLYESRDSASKYFEKVIAVSPKSQMASSSKLWLQLLEYHSSPTEQTWVQSVIAAPAISESQAILGQASDRLVRDLLDRELTIQQLRAMKEADAQSLESLQRDLAERDRKADTIGGRRDLKDSARGLSDTGMVLSLQKQLSDREKKIEELASQLEALKRIDQEMRDKVRPVRPPSTIAPSPTVPEPVTP